jgi:hypothetical protein
VQRVFGVVSSTSLEESRAFDGSDPAEGKHSEPIAEGEALGRFDPFDAPFGNDRYLRGAEGPLRR